MPDAGEKFAFFCFKQSYDLVFRRYLKVLLKAVRFDSSRFFYAITPPCPTATCPGCPRKPWFKPWFQPNVFFVFFCDLVFLTAFSRCLSQKISKIRNFYFFSLRWDFLPKSNCYSSESTKKTTPLVFLRPDPQGRPDGPFQRECPCNGPSGPPVSSTMQGGRGGGGLVPQHKSAPSPRPNGGWKVRGCYPFKTCFKFLVLELFMLV